MKQYKRLFKESQAEDYVKQIEDTIKKSFPKSYVNVRLESSLSEPNIYIGFTVGSKDKWSHGIMENDISMTKVLIYGVDKEGSLDNKLEFSPVTGGIIMVKPDEGSYYAYGRVKVGLRKKTGTPEQVLKHIDAYFKKLKTTLKANKDKIKEDDMKLLRGNF